MVLLFKTGIKNKTKARSLRPVLKKLTPDWNIDFEDHERILRIVSPTDISIQVIEELTSRGIMCQELQ